MIIISSLTKKYGGTYALHDLSLSVQKGEIVGLLGAKGCGKTTAMDLISGCIAPDSGRIEIGGADMAASEYAAKEKLGYAPAEPAIYSDLSVRRGMKFIADMRNLSAHAADAQIDRLLAQFSLSDIANLSGRSLASGARRIVGVAQALVGEVEALLIDEPSAGLDPKETVQLRAALNALRADYAILLATDNLTEAMKLCDRVYLLDKGRAVAEGPPASLADANGRGEVLRVTVLGDESALQSALSAFKPAALHSKNGRATASVSAPAEALGKALLAAGLPVLSMEPEPFALDDLLLGLKNESTEPEKEDAQ